MISSTGHTARFFLERWLQRGVLHQLLLMAGLVVGVAVLGGLLAWLLSPEFESPTKAIWWAFLRLTDPGYLGDDEGLALRVISTVVTVLGYVLFMGSLIAILTQWLAGTMRDLERGLTPISMVDHVVVLGWTSRTPEVVLQLLSGKGRLRRFLARTEARRLHIVVQAPEVDAQLRLELRNGLGAEADNGQIYLRSGSALDEDDLARLDLERAAAVLVPGDEFVKGGPDASDTRVIKTLLVVDRMFERAALEDRPFVVAELFDPLKTPIAARAFGEHAEVLSSDRTIGRILAQGLRHRDLARILLGILSHRVGCSVYLRRFPELAGHRPHALFESFPRAIVLGCMKATDGGYVAHLDPCEEIELAADDSIVFLAPKYDDCRPAAGPPRPADAAPSCTVPDRTPGAPPERRILLLGWSHKIAALSEELGAAGAERFSITVMSRFPIEEREARLSRAATGPGVVFEHIDGDYALAADIDAVDLEEFDNVAILASDWVETSEEADARTVLGYALLRSRLKDLADPPEVLAEFQDPGSSKLFDDRHGTFLVTPQIVSYFLAHIAMRPELGAVYDSLFCAGGVEISLRAPASLGLDGTETSFVELQRRAHARGAVALGVAPAGEPTELDPERSSTWRLGPDDRVVVMTSL